MEDDNKKGGRVYDDLLGLPENHQDHDQPHALLEKVWRISLYVTDYKALYDEKFSQIQKRDIIEKLSNNKKEALSSLDVLYNSASGGVGERSRIQDPDCLVAYAKIKDRGSDQI